MLGIFRRRQKIVFPKGIEGVYKFTKKQMVDEGYTLESIIESFQRRGDPVDESVFVTVRVEGEQITISWYVPNLLNSGSGY